MYRFESLTNELRFIVMNQTTKVENHILLCGMCDYAITIFEKHIFLTS